MNKSSNETNVTFGDNAAAAAAEGVGMHTSPGTSGNGGGISGNSSSTKPSRGKM